MKKITESQLKNRVNGLREYMVSLAEEADGANDQFSVNRDLQRQAATKAAAAPAAGAPADNRNIFQKGFDAVSDFHKQNTERFNAKQAADAAANSPEGMAAAKSKLTPSQLAWLGNAQPSPEILQRMPAPTAKEKADAAAAAPRGPGLKPPSSGGFAASLPPLDGSTPQPVGNQGLKMPAQAPVTSVAAAQAALGAGGGATTAAAPTASTWKGQTDEFGGMEEKPAAAVATPVASQTPTTATALPPLAPAKPNPYDIFKKADGSPAAPPGFKPPPPGVIWSKPDAGEQTTKVARFKELIAKAKELRTDKEVQASKDLGSFAGESTTYFLNKLRLIESRQLNEALTPEEQAEMDELSTELGQEGDEGDEELVAAINDYNSLPKSAPAAASAPAEKGEETFNKISGKWERSPASAAAAPASAAAAPASAPAAAPASAPAAAGRPADAAAMANANYSYVEKGSDQALAIAAGYGYDVAAWKAAGSPGKPRTQAQDDQNDYDTTSQPEYEYKEDPLNDRQTDTSNHQMAQNRNGIDPITGQNISIKDPLTGQMTNPESGKTTTAASPAYKGSAGAQKIQSLNKDIIKDVNKIYPGTPLTMPDKSIYTVKPGDTLDKIAKDYKPAGERIDVTKQIGNAPSGSPVNPLGKVPDKTRPPVPAAAAPSAAPAAAPMQRMNLSVPNAGGPAAAPAPAKPASAPAAAPAKPVAAGTGSGGGRGPTAQEFTNDWNNKMKAAQKLGWPDFTKLPPADWAPMGKPVTGKNKLAPDLKEAVTYADDQTLARIVSLSRR